MNRDMTTPAPAGNMNAHSGDAEHGSTVGILSPLARYSLAGLRRCFGEQQNRWSFKYHLDGRTDPNEFRPHMDLYYSLNVLLGLAPVYPMLTAECYDISNIFASICRDMRNQPVRNGAWGMALWAAVELGLDVPAIAADRLRPITADVASVAGWTAQDIGLSLSGVTAQLRHDAEWRPLAQGLRNLLLDRFRGPGALFRDSGKGPRQYLATFATQIYAALALYQYGEAMGDAEAIAAASTCAAKLIFLQGPLGEWPWFFLPGADRVLDFYEVYSVHQHGMAPALLHYAVRHEVAGARAAIERGFAWIFGANEMAMSMMVPERQLIYRSQARRGWQGRRTARLARSAVVAALGQRWPVRTERLSITREMRSYEFGWLLWSFGACSDYPALTHHPAFQNAIT